MGLHCESAWAAVGGGIARGETLRVGSNVPVSGRQVQRVVGEGQEVDSRQLKVERGEANAEAPRPGRGERRT